ncbi:MAG: alpha/beta hydrolase [Oscillospiraceae bacterium]|nr:alpha/beta hydrolase [Oscillospiraceae bacterium]
MRYIGSGADGKDTVLLLHGGGLSWWNYRKAAALLQDDFHVVLPILDGHAGSDRPFTTIRDNAEEILSFIDEHLGGSVQLLGGLSLGGQVALEMLALRGDVCRCALIESAAAIPSKIARALIGPAISSSYGLIKNEAFSRLQFRSLRIDPDLFADYYRDTCQISRSDMVAFMEATTGYALDHAIAATSARVHVFAGAKEERVVLRSAELLGKTVPGSAVTILPGLYHGEFSISHPQDYADAVRRILRT